MKTGRRTLWRGIAVGLILVVMAVVVVVLLRYANRPMFANEFSRGEMQLLPSWHIVPKVTRDNARGISLILIDTRLNTVALVSTGDPEFRGLGILRIEDGVTVLEISPKRVVRIPKVQNTLFLYSLDGTSPRQCPIVPGVAEEIGQMTFPLRMNLDGLFADYASRRGS